MYLGLGQGYVSVNLRIIAVINSYFRVDIGLHHGSAQTPFLFIMVIDVLTEKVITDLPGSMMFAELYHHGAGEVDMTECQESWRKVQEEGFGQENISFYKTLDGYPASLGFTIYALSP